jgi:hypothetical protein
VARTGRRDGEGQLTGDGDRAVEGGTLARMAEFAKDGARHAPHLGETAGLLRRLRPRMGTRPSLHVGVRVPEHGVEEADTGDAVTHRVVDADRDGLASICQRPDHVERPQRPTAVEVLGHQRADDPPHVGP